MLFQEFFISIATLSSIAAAVDLTGYEYVIVGSGAGGGVSILLLVLIETQAVINSASSLLQQDLLLPVTRRSSSRPVMTKAPISTTQSLHTPPGLQKMRTCHGTSSYATMKTMQDRLWITRLLMTRPMAASTPVSVLPKAQR